MKRLKSILTVAHIMVLAVVLVILAACGDGSPEMSPSAAGETTAPALELTVEELAEYNGKEGSPAYIAVDGVIYDVTSIPQWKNGDHNGFTAGNDLTEEIKNISPHGVSKLKGLPVVGTLKP